MAIGEVEQVVKSIDERVHERQRAGIERQCHGPGHV